MINSGPLDYLGSPLRTSTPLICRFDNPIEQSMIDFLLARRREALALVSVSDHQRAHLAETDLWRTIYNAVDTDRLAFAPRPDLVTSPSLAGSPRTRACTSRSRSRDGCGRPLRIAGNVSDEAGARDFFETRVRPQLGDGIEWVGPVDDDAKVPFLQNAAALLMPIQWDEPLLVVAEALACGTPVLAMNRASMPELIRHGVTGFLCRSTDEMVDAVGRSARSIGAPAARTVSSASRPIAWWRTMVPPPRNWLRRESQGSRARDLPKIACGYAR